MTTDGALGVGAVYIPGLHTLFESGNDLLSVLEVEPQTMWMRRDLQEQPYVHDPAVLERIAALPQKKLVHGVGFPVGGSRPPDPRHIAPLIEFIDTLGAGWASEHLAFNRARNAAGPYDTGFLLPPLQTDAGVEAASRSIRSVQKRLPVPFAIETGVNYLHRHDWELGDGAFVAAVAERADCGILLDLHNIWANEINGREPTARFMAELPLDRVWEIHVAGGMMVDGYWLDAHSGPVPGDVLALLREFLPEMPALKAVVFEITPTFLRSFGTAAVAREIEAIREIWTPPVDRAAVAGAARQRVTGGETQVSPAPCTPEEWEDALGAAVTGTALPAAGPFAEDPGIPVYRKLISNFRAGILSEALERTITLMILWLGKKRTRALLEEHFARSKPSLFYSAEARSFVQFLHARDPDIPCLIGVADFEMATIDVLVNRRAQLVRLKFRPETVFAAIAEGRRPETPEPCEVEVEIVPDSAPAENVGVRDPLH